jgi:hypothetical protein
VGITVSTVARTDNIQSGDETTPDTENAKASTESDGRRCSSRLMSRSTFSRPLRRLPSSRSMRSRFSGRSDTVNTKVCTSESASSTGTVTLLGHRSFGGSSDFTSPR